MNQNIDIVAMAMKNHCNCNEQKVQHFVRVYTLAKTIGELEKLPSITQEYLEIASLVCDIDELDLYKARTSDCARTLLVANNIDPEIIDRVCFIIDNYTNYDRITGLDHQILLEAEAIVYFKEHNTNRLDIIKYANEHFITNYGRAFLKKAFNV